MRNYSGIPNPYRKFALILTFPRSLFCKYVYLVEPRGAKTAFTALTHMQYQGFARKRIESVIEVGKKHVDEEGENLKKILENENNADK